MLFVTNHLQAQLLSVSDANIFLSRIINEELELEDNIFGGQKKIDISVNNNHNLVLRYIWEDNEGVIFPDFWNTDINYNEYEIDIKEIKSIEKYKNGNVYSVIVKCKDESKNCVSVNEEALLSNYSIGFCDRPNALNHFDFVNLFYSDNMKSRDIAYNGLRYSMNEVLRTINKNDLENPFSSNNNSDTKNRKVVVNLGESGGVSTLIAEIGNQELEFILDSGASDVSLPRTVESILLDSNTITKDDYLEPGLYMIADGSVKISNRFTVPFISVNGIKVSNVRCHVNDSEDVLLLGKSFLNRFKNWTIDNEFHQLILEY